MEGLAIQLFQFLLSHYPLISGGIYFLQYIELPSLKKNLELFIMITFLESIYKRKKIPVEKHYDSGNFGVYRKRLLSEELRSSSPCQSNWYCVPSVDLDPRVSLLRLIGMANDRIAHATSPAHQREDVGTPG